MGDSDLPDWVPALTSAGLRLEFPAGAEGAGLGLSLSGVEPVPGSAAREWSVRLASAAVSGKRVTVLVAGVAPDVGLKDLPVVGRFVPAGVGSVSGLALAARLSGGSGDVQACWDRLNGLLLAPGSTPVRPALPAGELDKNRLALGVEVAPLGSAIPVWVGFGGDTPIDPRSGDPEGEVIAGGGPGATAWIGVNRTIGPLQVRRVGLRYVPGTPAELDVLLDARLAAGGLAVSTTGLGVGVTWKRGDSPGVTGGLDGLGLSYTAGALEVSGALARDPDPGKKGATLLVAGQLSVSTTALSFTAAGMYAELIGSGDPSVFVIASLTGLEIPIGPVVLTGLTGGFGYNTYLSLPVRPLDVPSHPLVSGGLPVGDGPLAVLGKLGETVQPRAGSLWIAAGAFFTVFEIVRAKAVLALQLTPGDVTVALLATASAQFPTSGTPYACATLGLEATYRTSTGEIRVEGALDPDRSYLLSPSCRLRGGFALCVWTGPSHAGDFVFTLGGYHPAYVPPAHYPVVQRLGLDWQIDSVSVSGECYGAITPSMAMIGGRLEVSATVAGVKAWLEAHLDAVVRWAPFAFDVELGVRVGVSFDFLGHHDLELGADLHLWGPPTAGTATVHLPLVPDITVRFGSGSAAEPPPLGWDDFHKNVLAGRDPQVQVTQGLVPDPDLAAGKGTENGGKDNRTLRVTPEAFTLAITTPLPCTTLGLAARDTTSQVLDPATSDRRTVDVRPMDVAGATLHCTVKLYPTGTTDLVDLTAWVPSATTGALPASVFGKPPADGRSPSPYGGDELVPAVTGLTLTTPAARPVHPVGPMHRSVLETEHGKDGTLPPAAAPETKVPAPGDRDALVRAAKDTTAVREQLIASWNSWFPPVDDGTGHPPWDGNLDGYLDRLWSVTDAEPLLVS